MAVAPFEVIAGPAEVWIAPTGTAFPLVNAAPAAGWVSLGYTDGGITVSHTQDIETFYVDQIVTPIKTIRTTEGLTVEFAMAQMTLERYAQVMGGATITTDAGPPATKEFELQRGTTVQTHALLVRGPSPYVDEKMQYELPIVFQSEDPAVTFSRDAMATLSTTWTALADTALPEGEQFGRLVAQTA